MTSRWQRRAAGSGIAVVIAIAAISCRQGEPETPPPGRSTPATDGRPRRALLVGVGRYDLGSSRTAGGATVVPDLSGPRNDIALARNLLLRRFGFPDGSVRVLMDRDATLESVVRGIHEHLIEGVTADTEVVLWFSGHGSRIVDPSKSEESGHAATLVLHDSRVGVNDGSRDLDDDALHSLLAACPSHHITVITDACHSGDVTRDPGTEQQSRLATEVVGPLPRAANDRWSFWPADVPFLAPNDERRRSDLPWLHIAACESHEQAWEYTTLKPPALLPAHRHFGRFSYFLCDALMRSPPGTSWDAVARRVYSTALTLVPPQHVALHGPATREVFGERFATAVHGHAARSLDTERLVVEGGAIHGLTEGAEGEVFRLLDRAVIGSAKIEAIELAECLARWIGDPPSDLDLDEALAFVPAHSKGGIAPLRVATPSVDDLRQRLATDPSVELVDGRDDGTLYQASDSTGRIELRSSDGFVVWPRAPFDMDDPGLTAATRQEAEFQWLWALAEHAGGGLPIRMGLQARTPGDFEEVEAGRRYALDRADEGTPKRAVLTFDLDREAYLVVLALDPRQRSVVPIWPRSSAGEARSASLGTGGRFAARFSVTTGTPPGRCTDRVLAIASDRPLDLSNFVFRGDRTRGGGSSALLDLDNRTWGIAVLDVIVR